MAKCYVGTYEKYNNGSIYGKWLDLDDYQYYQQFLNACKHVHKNERDPEYMIQDWEGLPDGFSAMSGLARATSTTSKQQSKRKRKPTCKSWTIPRRQSQSWETLRLSKTN